ncbi:hypothetical protein LWE61_14640 [Sphingobium sufflavum]|uniref:hypothetical protein n=1 Tax=Sphingobium sufflavum TaxID=1129547 RepID=UPI001F3EF200|nr:hypothetical protein [Sphingobium sufflavum]MCE7797786.1 hypothetical protein [Sphingobium sufflavum]
MTDTSIEKVLAADAEAAEESGTARIGAFVSEHPFAAAGAAIAVGAVIGLALPRWRVGAAAGSALVRTAKQAAKAVAAAETARTVLSGLTAATVSVKAGAHRLADHVPDAETVKAGAKRALERASETAHKAGEKVANTVSRTVKAGED